MFNPIDHMMKLKGKDYLQVMWRLVWFRDEKPEWGISTEMIAHDTESGNAVFRAVVCDENGATKSTGYGSESKRDFCDYLEKAETKAVGRALAMLGYGTQFAPDLDEGERVVDSPVSKPHVQHTKFETLQQSVDAKMKTLSTMTGETEAALKRRCLSYIGYKSGADLDYMAIDAWIDEKIHEYGAQGS